MTAAELDAFLRTELPQIFNYDDLTERRRIRSPMRYLPIPFQILGVFCGNIEP